jgi:hypothetical protein
VEEKMRRPHRSAEFERQRSILSELNGNILLYDGYEDALVGFVERFGESPVAVYDKKKCLKILESDGMKPEEALEWFNYNTLGAGCGPETPVFITFLKDIE